MVFELVEGEAATPVVSRRGQAEPFGVGVCVAAGAVGVEIAGAGEVETARAAEVAGPGDRLTLQSAAL
jgi:hypothetical protein